jgi:hypothetical protein
MRYNASIDQGVPTLFQQEKKESQSTVGNRRNILKHEENDDSQQDMIVAGVIKNQGKERQACSSIKCGLIFDPTAWPLVSYKNK